jgi:hypothetical protein
MFFFALLWVGVGGDKELLVDWGFFPSLGYMRSVFRRLRIVQLRNWKSWGISSGWRYGLRRILAGRGCGVIILVHMLMTV